jgi:hypothetical protein
MPGYHKFKMDDGGKPKSEEPVMPISNTELPDFDNFMAYVRQRERDYSIGSARDMANEARKSGKESDYPTTTGIKGKTRPLGSEEMFSYGGKTEDKALGGMKMNMKMGGRTFNTED